MTNEEAKEIMSKVTFYWELGEQTLTQNQINEALDMAIKALEQTDVLDKIRAEIAEIQLIGYATVDGKREIASRAVMQIIDKYIAESEG